MPNHYTMVALCHIDYDAMDKAGKEQVDLSPLKNADLCELAVPTPDSIKGSQTLEWCSENWGTKWGTYQTEAIELPGDGSPVLLSCVAAWCPPKPEVMRKIEDYLTQNYHLIGFRWLGFDPFDDSVEEIASGN